MNKNKICIIILIIFLFQAIQLVSWINKDSSNPAWDQSWHAMISANKYNQLFGKSNLTTGQLEKIYPLFGHTNNLYPPFYHISTIPFYIFFGNNYSSALLTNTLFILILILSTFFIGKKLYNEETGLVMAFVISIIPVYSSLIRDYLIDFSLASMISLGLVLLIYTENFEKGKYSILFGIVFGLGILTKWTYPLYIILPLFFSLFEFFKKNILIKKDYKKLQKLIFPLLFALLVTSFWYNLKRINTIVPIFLRYSGQGAVQGDPSFFSFQGLIYYLKVMISDLSLFYFALIIMSIFLIFIYTKKRKTYVVFILQVVFTYIIFTLISNKSPRYIAPLYIFLVSIFGFLVFSLKKRNLRFYFIAIIIFFGIFQNLTYNSQKINFDYNIAGVSFFNSKGIYPGKSGFDINQILSEINKSNKGKEFSVCIISETPQLNDVNIPYYAMIYQYLVSNMKGNGCNPLYYDYSIVGPRDGTWRSTSFISSKSIINKNIENFKVIYSSKGVLIYRRK